MKITCHMIMSVDGRLISKYWSPLYNACLLYTSPSPRDA